jgi:hypothetical protein
VQEQNKEHVAESWVQKQYFLLEFDKARMKVIRNISCLNQKLII